MIGITAIKMNVLNEEPVTSGEAVGLLGAFIGAALVVNFIMTVVGCLYFAFMESSQNQGTLGKMALGIKVTNMNGERITFINAVGRYFAKILSGMIICIGYIMAGFTEKKQALHDILANCLVIKK